MANTFKDPRVETQQGFKYVNIYNYSSHLKIILEFEGGEQPREYFVHQNVLESSSSQFFQAVTKEWKSGQDKLVQLKDHQPEMLEAYLQWLYSGTVYARFNKHSKMPKTYQYLGELYALGEVILDRKFQNRVVDAIVACCHEERTNSAGHPGRFYPAHAVGAIYKSTTTGSPGRKLLVDCYVRHGGSHWIDLSLDGTSEDAKLAFPTDLSKALLDHREVRASSKSQLTEIHEGVPKSYYHDEDVAATREAGSYEAAKESA